MNKNSIIQALGFYFILFPLSSLGDAKLLWTVTAKENIYTLQSSPTELLVHHEQDISSKEINFVRGLEKATGKTLWEFSIGLNRITYSRYHQGVFYIASRGYYGDAIIYALASHSGEVLWQKNLGSHYYPEVSFFDILNNQFIYFLQGRELATSPSKIVSVNLLTGSENWTHSLEKYGMSTNYQVLVNNDNIVITSGKCKNDVADNKSFNVICLMTYDYPRLIQVLNIHGKLTFDYQSKNTGLKLFALNLESNPTILSSITPNYIPTGYGPEFSFQLANGKVRWTVDGRSSKRISFNFSTFDFTSGAIEHNELYTFEDGYSYLPGYLINGTTYEMYWDNNFRQSGLVSYNPTTTNSITYYPSNMDHAFLIGVIHQEPCFVSLSFSNLLCFNTSTNSYYSNLNFKNSVGVETIHWDDQDQYFVVYKGVLSAYVKEGALK